ncbi:hypothetical protein EDC04DRAFT_2613598 [Pisolithus marmoratus]|nr:hypothetical protein EDC04DRAFT_2613598 [Pisolithus marmoratus]
MSFKICACSVIKEQSPFGAPNWQISIPEDLMKQMEVPEHIIYFCKHLFGDDISLNEVEKLEESLKSAYYIFWYKPFNGTSVSTGWEFPASGDSPHHGWGISRAAFQ